MLHGKAPDVSMFVCPLIWQAGRPTYSEQCNNGMTDWSTHPMRWGLAANVLKILTHSRPGTLQSWVNVCVGPPILDTAHQYISDELSTKVSTKSQVKSCSGAHPFVVMRSSSNQAGSKPVNCKGSHALYLVSIAGLGQQRASDKLVSRQISIDQNAQPLR